MAVVGVDGGGVCVCVGRRGIGRVGWGGWVCQHGMQGQLEEEFATASPTDSIVPPFLQHVLLGHDPTQRSH